MSADLASNRRPTGSVRSWLVAAGVAAICSLGLTWGIGGASSSGDYIPGWYAPGYCTTVYDDDGGASMDCTSGFVSPGYYTGYGSSTGATGAGQPARVFLALGAAAVVFGYRRQDRRLVAAAPVIMTIGLAVTGLNPGPGMVAYTLGLACLVWGLRLDGVLRVRPRTPRALSPA